MKLSERTIVNKYEKYKDRAMVQMSFRVERPTAYEFKRIAKKKGLYCCDIVDAALKLFIAQEKGSVN